MYSCYSSAEVEFMNCGAGLGRGEGIVDLASLPSCMLYQEGLT
jgi:hypothetical protein